MEASPEPPYLVRFRSQHPPFRIPELESIADLFEIQFRYDEAEAQRVAARIGSREQAPFLKAWLPSRAAVLQMASRSVSAQGFYELVGEGETFEELSASFEKCHPRHKTRLLDGTTFKIVVDSYGRKFTPSEQLGLINKLENLPLWDTAALSLANPEREYHLFLDFGVGHKDVRVVEPRRIYFAELVAEGRLPLIDKFDVKKRDYIGTTSMDSELSLYVANQAQARPGSLVFDPFVGTGSLLLTAAYFGALTLGGDIDPRVLRGKDASNVFSNFAQHDLSSRLLGLVVCDHAHSPWRTVPFLDAIVADPPYGVRAGARKVGKKRKTLLREQKRGPQPRHGRVWQDPSHVVQCVAYEVNEVLHDLLAFSARTLRLGGRLVYWLPTTSEYRDDDLPKHPCLTLVANSEQPMTTNWRRRLITMTKTREWDAALDALSPEEYGQQGQIAHANLAAKWMKDTSRTDANRAFSPQATSETDISRLSLAAPAQVGPE